MPQALVMLLALVVGGGLFITSVLGGLYPGYSVGSRVGTVQKVSSKGVLCTSTVGELVLDGFGSAVTKRQGGDQSALRTVWEFGTSSPDVARRIEELAGQRVRMTYRQWLIQPFCLGSDYDITAIEPVR